MKPIKAEILSFRPNILEVIIRYISISFSYKIIDITSLKIVGTHSLSYLSLYIFHNLLQPHSKS